MEAFKAFYAGGGTPNQRCPRGWCGWSSGKHSGPGPTSETLYQFACQKVWYEFVQGDLLKVLRRYERRGNVCFSRLRFWGVTNVMATSVFQDYVRIGRKITRSILVWLQVIHAIGRPNKIQMTWNFTGSSVIIRMSCCTARLKNLVHKVWEQSTVGFKNCGARKNIEWVLFCMKLV